MKPISRALAGLSGDGLSEQTTFDTDHGHFMLEGIPALDLWVDMSHYGEVHHKTSDTIDKVDAHNLTSGAAIVAITAYAVADRAEPIAPRRSRGRRRDSKEGESGWVLESDRRVELRLSGLSVFASYHI